MTNNRLELTVPDGEDSKTRSFPIVPTIGHCLELKGRGIDLLGTDGDADVAKLVANPEAFCEILEVVIGSDDDQFKMPALAGLLTGESWVNARRVVLGSFRDFFQSSGHPQIAAALDRLSDAAESITDQVAESLTSGALRKAIDDKVAETVQEMETVNAGD